MSTGCGRFLILVAVPFAEVVTNWFVDVERLQFGMPELVLAAEVPDASHEALADPCRLLVLGKAAETGLERSPGLDSRSEALPVFSG